MKKIDKKVLEMDIPSLYKKKIKQTNNYYFSLTGKIISFLYFAFSFIKIYDLALKNSPEYYEFANSKNLYISLTNILFDNSDALSINLKEEYFLVLFILFLFVFSIILGVLVGLIIAQILNYFVEKHTFSMSEISNQISKKTTMRFLEHPQKGSPVLPLVCLLFFLIECFKKFNSFDSLSIAIENDKSSVNSDFFALVFIFFAFLWPILAMLRKFSKSLFLRKPMASDIKKYVDSYNENQKIIEQQEIEKENRLRIKAEETRKKEEQERIKAEQAQKFAEQFREIIQIKPVDNMGVYYLAENECKEAQEYLSNHAESFYFQILRKSPNNFIELCKAVSYGSEFSAITVFSLYSSRSQEYTEKENKEIYKKAYTMLKNNKKYLHEFGLTLYYLLWASQGINATRGEVQYALNDIRRISLISDHYTQIFNGRLIKEYRSLENLQDAQENINEIRDNLAPTLKNLCNCLIKTFVSFINDLDGEEARNREIEETSRSIAKSIVGAFSSSANYSNPSSSAVGMTDDEKFIASHINVYGGNGDGANFSPWD